MGSAGFSIKLPPRQDQEEVFENKARLRYSLLEHGYEKFFDLYTFNSIFKLGFLEYFTELFTQYNLLEYGHFIIVIGYIISLFFIAFLLGRICRFLPLIFYSYLIWISYSQGLGLVPQLLFILWVSFRIISILYYTERVTSDTLKTQIYKPKRSVVTGSVNIGFLLLISLCIAMLLAPPELQKGASIMFPLVIVFLGSSMIPGVGANSTLGVVSLVLLGLIGLLAVPMVAEVVLENIVRILRPRSGVPMVDVPTQAGTVINNMLQGGHWVLGFSETSVTGVLRHLLGFFIVGWMFFDSLLGPGYSNTVAAEIKVKGKELQIGTAGIYTSFWVITPLSIMIQCFVTRSMMTFIIAILGYMLSGVVWFCVGRRVWISRGQAASLTDMRSGMDYIMGQGPSGVRKLLIDAGLLGALTLLCIDDPAWTSVLFLLCLLLRNSERFKTIVLGLLSLNLFLVWAGFAKNRPICGELEDESIPAYNPVVSYNNSGGEQVKPSVVLPSVITTEEEEPG